MAYKEIFCSERGMSSRFKSWGFKHEKSKDTGTSAEGQSFPTKPVLGTKHDFLTVLSLSPVFLVEKDQPGRAWPLTP